MSQKKRQEKPDGLHEHRFGVRTVPIDSTREMNAQRSDAAPFVGGDMGTFTRVIALVASIPFLAMPGLPGARAAGPKTLSYQGYLTTSGGAPVNGTTVTQFSIAGEASAELVYAGSGVWYVVNQQGTITSP